MSELEAIREIGRYQIVRQIGRGGMARVYLARDPRLRRYVAIKVIAADTHSDEYFRRAFEREAGAIGSLQHPNILPVYDIGEHDGHSYMVMHYVEGGRTLRDVITAGRLEPAQASYTMSQIAAALSYAHAAGLIHRDVKPQNVLIDATSHLYLADFGLAKATAEASANTMATYATMGSVGTPVYMSPEQVQASQPPDHRADIYSLGVIGFELLTGVQPFTGDIYSIMYQHVHAEVPSARVLDPRLPLEVDDVLRKVLAKRPSDRYTTAVEFATALKDALGNLGAAPMLPLLRSLPPGEAEPEPAAGAPITELQTMAGKLGPPPSGAPQPEAPAAPLQRPAPLSSGNGALPMNPAAPPNLARPSGYGLGGGALSAQPTPAPQPTAPTPPILPSQPAALSPAAGAPPVTPTPPSIPPQQPVTWSPTAGSNSSAGVTPQRSTSGSPSIVGKAAATGFGGFDPSEIKRPVGIEREAMDRVLAGGSTSDTAAAADTSKRLVPAMGLLGFALVVAYFTSTLAGGAAGAGVAGVGLLLAIVMAVRAIRAGRSTGTAGEAGAEARVLQSSETPINSIAFAPDGREIVAGSFDEFIRIWNVETGKIQRELEGHRSHIPRVNSVVFTRDGRTLASGGDDAKIILWEFATGKVRRILEGHEKPVHTLAFSPDGRTLASGSDDGSIRLWDVNRGRAKHVLSGHRDEVFSVAFSPDGRMLASGSRDNTIRLWDVASGEARQTLRGHDNWVYAVAFSPDGRLLASGSNDYTIVLWELASGHKLNTLRGHLGGVWSVAFTYDGYILASGSNDKTILLWDVATGDILGSLEGHKGGVWSVAFVPNGHTLASGSYDRTIRLWPLTD